MAVRRGEPSMEEILDQLDDAVHRIERVLAAAELPQFADGEGVDGFLIDAYERFWTSGTWQ